MNPLHSVLVGVDFTPWSAAALNQAIRLAAWDDAAVHVLHAIDVCAVTELEVGLADLGETPEGLRDCFVQEARAEWEQFAAPVPGARELDLEVVIGTPADVVLGRARRHAADLVVLGVQGAVSGVGAVAAACLRRGGVDVLLVRRQQGGPFKVVVGCVDFSEASGPVLAEAARVAARDRAALHVVHVYHGPWHPLQYWPRTPGMAGDYPRRYRDTMLRRLEGIYRLSSQTPAGVKPQFHVFEHAGYVAGIAEFAADVGADLIVLGRRDRWSIEEALLGGTAERVGRQAGCSVLAVRQNAAEERGMERDAGNVQTVASAV